MGKNKRLTGKTPKRPKHPATKLSRPSGVVKAHSKPAKKHVQHAHTAPTIPFQTDDHILLVGEADLSFSSALLALGFPRLTPTVYESSEGELCEKYPSGEGVGGARGNIDVLREGGVVVRYGVDVTRRGWMKGGMRWERVVFNFPHVGGKSTDVNRQVRYNQELLVSFFKSSISLLSPTPGSSILVTLFEGEPYTLWNIRDLARHSGLEVLRSFRFQAGAYEGYRHARTLGVVKGGGGWKGEDRLSRTYEFVRKGEGVKQGTGKKAGSDDEEDENEMGGDEGQGGSEAEEVMDEGHEGMVEDEEHASGADDEDKDG
ncbi:hypothetical protein GLAREA_11157 [Glarea lozoyensis ATCC 20868]|uniref:25S rRNA (uridine-N(3))-methyltransferase BMT5-like domain-containing protein n=1 Tax=Glarea lozoyensis (strain ATCC 20868 / MF5171) TaxID=1116229 RepID=S3EAV4_GLAL2|nr:uncharacterized protein GLAREA_11157 [Glarea lozoyensis ATCC 20868]EPE35458.1 hypothetical protein GLAREA_11157 [Glarea lozoyensis ATCC 20868]